MSYRDQSNAEVNMQSKMNEPKELNPLIPVNQREKESLITIQIGKEYYTALVDTAASRSVLTTAPQNSKPVGTILVKGTNGKAERVLKLRSKVIKFGPLTVDHSFLLMPECPSNLIGRDVLCKLVAIIQCDSSGQLFLYMPKRCLKHHLILFLDHLAEEEQGCKSNIYEIPDNIPAAKGARNSMDVGKIKSTEPIKIEVTWGHPT